jgi:hypothetical protein
VSDRIYHYIGLWFCVLLALALATAILSIAWTIAVFKIAEATRTTIWVARYTMNYRAFKLWYAERVANNQWVSRPADDEEGT